VDQQTPPAFLAHETADDAVKPENSKRYHEACKKNGVPTRLVIVEGGMHGPAILNGFLRGTRDKRDKGQEGQGTRGTRDKRDKGQAKNSCAVGLFIEVDFVVFYENATDEGEWS
jgi:acetyl esterase/lipase